MATSPDSRTTVADGVVGDGTAEVTCGVLAVEVGQRLGLGHRVRAGGQVLERVAAIGPGGGHDADGIACAVGAGERDGDPFDRAFAEISGAVVVQVFEDVAGQRCRLDHTKVDGAHGVARGEHDRFGQPVRVDRVVRPSVTCGGDQPERRCEGDGVVTGHQTVEQVGTDGVGGGRQRDCGTVHVGALQGHVDTVDTGLAAVLDAVAVGVEPHVVADRGGAHLAEVLVGDRVAGGDDDGEDLGGRRVAGVNVARWAGSR